MLSDESRKTVKTEMLSVFTDKRLTELLHLGAACSAAGRRCGVEFAAFEAFDKMASKERSYTKTTLAVADCHCLSFRGR